jgi:hypothetical protein
MAIFSSPSPAARNAVIYVTAGTLTLVWSGIWFWYLEENPPINNAVWYFCYGFLLTGLALLVIGLGIGQIGRSARHADLPAAEVVQTAAEVEKEVIPRPAIAYPLNPQTPSAVPVSPTGGTTSPTPMVAPSDPRPANQ